MTSAASDLAAIASNVNAAHMVAATRTTAVLPAAADEVSTGIAALFSQHAASYQALAGQAAALQQQFVQHLHAGAFSYANAEAAIAAFLQPLPFALWVQNLPTEISFIASDPLQFLTILLLLVTAPVLAPLFLLFVGSLLAVILGLGGLAILAQQLTSLLASFGI
jgi:hypothetical protein